MLWEGRKKRMRYLAGPNISRWPWASPFTFLWLCPFELNTAETIKTVIKIAVVSSVKEARALSWLTALLCTLEFTAQGPTVRSISSQTSPLNSRCSHPPVTVTSAWRSRPISISVFPELNSWTPCGRPKCCGGFHEEWVLAL